MDPCTFDREMHLIFLEMMLDRLPEDYQSQEINRLTLAHFIISSLAVLDALDRVNADQLVNWVLSFQVHPRNDTELKNGQFYGFGGSAPSNSFGDDDGAFGSNCSHIASTYCALAILKVVGYGFSNSNFEPILVSMRKLQLPDGSFMPMHTGAEADLRFLYCAAAICYMLNNWTGMDKVKSREYILKCQLTKDLPTDKF